MLLIHSFHAIILLYPLNGYHWLAVLGYANKPYHAGLSPLERRSLERLWLEDELQFIVCTSAFGMGINKPNVRWIIHYQNPQSLSQYLQEIGRGGRDEKETEVITLVSEPTGWIDKSDREREQFFRDRLLQQAQKAQAIARMIPQEGRAEEVEKLYPEGAIALSLLHRDGCLEWLDPFRYRLTSNKVKTPLAQDSILTYLHTHKCRWAYLLSAFGFPPPSADWRCDHCDNCEKK